MTATKKLLISQVQIVKPFDQAAIPTKIRYSGKQHFVGQEAETEQEDSSGCYENFKVSVGRVSRQQAQTALQNVSSRHKRSVVGMTKDFLSETLRNSKKRIEAAGENFPKKVLVAEPLSIEEEGEVSRQWLKNYRSNLRTALADWFEDIDFLPEPFAVFQYYRYGLRHPLVADQQKYVALVLDFGGGTLDVSVIETTAEGDISRGGKNSRPLSAKSIPAAGFYINQRLAEDVLFSTLSGKEAKIQARNIISKIVNFQGLGDDEKARLGERELAFVDNFVNLLSQIEKAKVRLCNSISDWSLSANLPGTLAHLVQVPEDPFSVDTRKIEISLRAVRLREVFETRVWDERLKSAISNAITRAQKELNGKQISVVLLSGGSTNIRWLKHLLVRDLAQQFKDAEILELSENYQEVVAKGLAIECARQFYTEGDGDFGAVTYNRLNLALKPDEKDLKWCNFRPISAGLPKCEDEGTLLPSSTSLRSFINKPMSWKAHLDSAPRTKLTYQYLKSSFDPTDLDSVYNIGADMLSTPKGAKFGSSIQIELTVRDDGTATPAFIYAKGRQETRVEGSSFNLDMTFADAEGSRDAYLGLDFGTATSAVSLVSRAHITAYVDRSRDKKWLELGDLVQELPYPIAHPLGVYITQTDAGRLEHFGRATLEAALTFIAYVSLCDIACSTEKLKIDQLFRNYKRSAGPLKHLIQETCKLNKAQSPLAKELLSIIDEDTFSQVDEAITNSAKAKHFRPGNIDYNHILGMLGNHIKRSLSGRIVGVFEGMSKKDFEDGYRGRLRCLEGANSPFVRLFNYEGGVDFSSAEIFIADVLRGSVIPISPLYIWGLGDRLGLQSGDDLYYTDIVNPNAKKYIFAHIQKGEEISLLEHADLQGTLDHFNAVLENKKRLTLISNLSFDVRSV